MRQSAHRDHRPALRPDGGIELRTGAQTFGQGQPTTMPLILARLLDVDQRSIRLVQGDSDVVPDGIATVASRFTVMRVSCSPHR